MKEPDYVAATLEWCNERRKEQGKKPLRKLPKGVRRDPNSCPCGKATGLSVLAQYAFNTGEVFWLPYKVTKFVDVFDEGKLPQYEAK